MKPIARLLIAFVLGATSTPALADDPPPVYVPEIVKSCKVYKVPSVGEVCGFVNLEDWKLVLQADAELVYARFRLKNLDEKNVALARQVQLLQGQVTLYSQNQGVLVLRVDELTKQLIDLDMKYQEERVKPRLGSAWPWTIAAISTSILAGVVVAGVLD